MRLTFSLTCSVIWQRINVKLVNVHKHGELTTLQQALPRLISNWTLNYLVSEFHGVMTGPLRNRLELSNKKGRCGGCSVKVKCCKFVHIL
jgi:hypothetical protein